MNALPPIERGEAPPHAPIALSIDRVSYRYGRHGLFGGGRVAAPWALDSVSLDVRVGETLALVGESGSGKSTLARAIAGLAPVERGRISFGGSDITAPVERRSKLEQRRIQIIFQNPDASLNGRHRIGTILERPLSLFFGLPAAKRRAEVRALLEAVQLPADYARRFPSEISGGERQRVAIARALAAKPEFLICDEIVSALDVSVQAAILDLLAGLQRRTRLTMLFITHDLAVVRWFADRVVVLYRGQVCEIAQTADLFAPPYHPYTAVLLEAAPQLGRRAIQRAARPRIEVSSNASGCPFAASCRYAIADRCDAVAPPWRDVAPPGHTIRCHLEPALLAEIGRTPIQAHKDRP
jgi:peptide/nickel transport system ATP-binding protein